MKLLTATLLLLSYNVNGFSVIPTFTQHHALQQKISSISSSVVNRGQVMVTYMSDVNSSEGEQSEISEEVAAAAENEEPQEDPEITAMKEEIESLEAHLKAKRLEANRLIDLADDYTEKGYVRKCAEMENMRRGRAEASKGVKDIYIAKAVKNFLPTLDSLKVLKTTYEGDDFASSYSALGNEFESSLASFGLTEIIIEQGERVDKTKVTAVSEEFVEGVEAGIVLKVLRYGYEMNGSTIQFAEAIVSKGPEAEEEEQEEEKIEEA